MKALLHELWAGVRGVGLEALVLIGVTLLATVAAAVALAVV